MYGRPAMFLCAYVLRVLGAFMRFCHTIRPIFLPILNFLRKFSRPRPICVFISLGLEAPRGQKIVLVLVLKSCKVLILVLTKSLDNCFSIKSSLWALTAAYTCCI